MKKVQTASRLLRMICISSCSGCVWLWWQYTVFIIRCYKFGETASSRRQRLKGSLNRMRFCTSNLLWDQFTTAMELHSDVKKTHNLVGMKWIEKREEGIARRQQREYWAIPSSWAAQKINSLIKPCLYKMHIPSGSYHKCCFCRKEHR